VNKVYRIVIEDSAADPPSSVGQRAATVAADRMEPTLCLLHSGAGRAVVRVRGPGVFAVCDLGGRRIVGQTLPSPSTHDIVLPQAARGMYVVSYRGAVGAVVRRRMMLDY
jgi:hypothetical protein